MFIYLVTVSASKLEEVRLTFMAALLSKDQVKFSKLNSDFSNLIFVSCHKLLKMYSPSELFKDGLKLYVFESLKLKATF